MHHHYRRLVLRLYRRFRHPRVLKANRLKRWFARHFLDKTVWKPTRHTLAGGLAVGFFVMMLVIPGQMPLAMLLAALLRVNIPIAIVACCIVNPVTMAPVAWWEIKFGNAIVRLVGLGDPPPLHWEELKAMFDLVTNWASLGEFFAKLKPWTASLYVGGIVIGALLAPVGYAASHFFWDLTSALRHRRAKKDGAGAGTAE